jgi:hypothetical protein
MISKSPDRNTFQKEGYIKRCEEQGKLPNPEYIEMFKSWQQQRLELEETDEWKVDNMEYDLRSTQWIVDKVKGDDVYAQHLYAAMCNNDFTKNDVWPILTEKRWGASWRHAGGIIADMQEKGDYIDWYCSGIRDAKELDDTEFQALTKEQQEGYIQGKKFVPESVVTDEIREDLLKLGWIVIDGTDDTSSSY